MPLNYQRELSDIIRQLSHTGKVPSLLLHCCCAPCSSYVLEYLSEYFKITTFYYNPNIYPAEEYAHRVSELKRFVAEFHTKNPVSFVEGTYEPERYYAAVKGLEKEPEGGARCYKCFELRLEEAAKFAKNINADYFTTTLTISPVKDAEVLNKLGEEVGAKYGIRHLPSNFKRKGGYQRSIELSHEYGLYRQNFCGCVYSKEERERFDKMKSEGQKDSYPKAET
ncbi:MAG: epoxyqueuosine reductase QueH [Fibrobacteraceae bacterium]|nr:epoxyqueuosine reductase QueH [Fibrobacteraceae bacterium]